MGVLLKGLPLHGFVLESLQPYESLKTGPYDSPVVSGLKLLIYGWPLILNGHPFLHMRRKFYTGSLKKTYPQSVMIEYFVQGFNFFLTIFQYEC